MADAGERAPGTPPAAGKPESKAELKALLDETRQFRDDYEKRFNQYKSNSRMSRALGAIGVEAAYEYYGISKDVSRKTVNAFLKEWEDSTEFRELRQRFEALVDRVGSFLRGVSEVVPSLRPPGNSQKLAAKLKSVRSPFRLDTKIRHLLVVLDDLDTRTLIRNQDIPPVAPRKPGPKRSKPRRAIVRPQQASAPDPGLAWTLVGVILGVFLALALGLLPFIGWISFVVAALATVALVMTRKYWVSPVVKLAKDRR